MDVVLLLWNSQPWLGVGNPPIYAEPVFVTENLLVLFIATQAKSPPVYIKQKRELKCITIPRLLLLVFERLAFLRAIVFFIKVRDFHPRIH
jgi:hypothetical protein